LAHDGVKHVDAAVKVHRSPGLLVPGKDIVVPPGSGGSGGSNGVKGRRCAAPWVVPSTRNGTLFFHGTVRPEEHYKEAEGNTRLAVWRRYRTRAGFNLINTLDAGDRASEAAAVPTWTGDYDFVNDMMFSHKFCLAPSGNSAGWGSRVHLSAMKGCVPVMIQPHTAAVLEEALDFSAFGVRVDIAVRRCKLTPVATRVESTWIQRSKLRCGGLLSRFELIFKLRRYMEDVARLPEILAAVSPAQLLAKQHELHCACHAMRWPWEGFLDEAERLGAETGEAMDEAMYFSAGHGDG
jgi:hypothetical protein